MGWSLRQFHVSLSVIGSVDETLTRYLRYFLSLFPALTMDNDVYYCFVNTTLVTSEMSKRERFSWGSQGGGGGAVMT